MRHKHNNQWFLKYFIFTMFVLRYSGDILLTEFNFKKTTNTKLKRGTDFVKFNPISSQC